MDRLPNQAPGWGDLGFGLIIGLHTLVIGALLLWLTDDVGKRTAGWGFVGLGGVIVAGLGAIAVADAGQRWRQRRGTREL